MSTRLHLRLRQPPALRVSLDDIVPETGADATEVARRPLWLGREAVELGELFDVSAQALAGDATPELVIEGDCRRIDEGRQGGHRDDGRDQGEQAEEGQATGQHRPAMAGEPDVDAGPESDRRAERGYPLGDQSDRPGHSGRGTLLDDPGDRVRGVRFGHGYIRSGAVTKPVAKTKTVLVVAP